MDGNGMKGLAKRLKRAEGLAVKVFDTDEQYWDSLSVKDYLAALKAAEASFLGFVKLLHPRWEIPAAHLELIEALDRLEKGELRHELLDTVCTNAQFNMPPRHAKSAYVTVMFAAYYICRCPQRSVMTGSYSATLAEGFGKQVRDIIELPVVRQAFPNVRIDPLDRSKAEWGLVDGGGTSTGGKYYAVGLGGTTTGRPANLLIWDDPIKTKEEADSATSRNKAWDFITYSLQTRKQPLLRTVNGQIVREPAIEIAILTRWNVDDPGGRIQETPDWKEGRWFHFLRPAIIDEGKPTEKALWPDAFPLEELKRIRKADPARFEALYQQQPFTKGGSIFKTSWWKSVKELPKPDQLVCLVCGADTAFKASENNDPTALVFAGLGYDGNFYIYEVFEKHLEFPDLKRLFVTMNGLWKSRGLRGFYIEDRASGQSLVQELRRMGGVPVIPHALPGDKAVKARGITPLVEGGLVYLPEYAPWVDDFISEFEQFTGDAAKKERDNKVDATVIALDVLSRISGPAQISQGVGAFQISPGRSLNESIKAARATSAWKGWGQ